MYLDVLVGLLVDSALTLSGLILDNCPPTSCLVLAMVQFLGAIASYGFMIPQNC